MAEENKQQEKTKNKKKFSYAQKYKEQYKSKYTKSKKQENILKKAEQAIIKEEKTIKKEAEEVAHFIKEPKHIRILKILVIIAVLGIILYLITVNFLISRDFNYFYDIGSAEDAKKPYLTPLNRISDIFDDSGADYRNLISPLVYFDVLIPRGAESVRIEARIKDNFPENSVMSLGAKDQEVWHYNYHSIYNPALNHLSEFPKKENVYLVNPNLYLLTPEELKYERDIVVATDKLYTPLTNTIADYQEKETIINTSLRGGHTAYIYAAGDLNLEIKKQDINWYEGSDELEISLYDANNNLIANTTIADDGETGVKNKKTAQVQEGVLQATNLKEGVYKLEFKDFDGLIREIKINTNKIVFDKVFLADNSIYNVDTKPSKIYLKSNRDEQLDLITYHAAGIQKIDYIKEGKKNVFDFYQEDAPLYMNLTKGDYEFTIPQNDIIFSGMPYFAFSKENYFEPFKQKVISIKNDFEWLKNNVDYIVTDYKPPELNEGWLIAETEFDIEKDGLFVKDNKLSVVFNIPHLSKEPYLEYTIPIDWINITVHKSGLFEKWGWTK